ncbi:MAG: hypothetical protein V4439_02485 [Patescibacteria group bacterium]
MKVLQSLIQTQSKLHPLFDKYFSDVEVFIKLVKRKVGTSFIFSVSFLRPSFNFLLTIKTKDEEESRFVEIRILENEVSIEYFQRDKQTVKKSLPTYSTVMFKVDGNNVDVFVFELEFQVKHFLRGQLPFKYLD